MAGAERSIAFYFYYFDPIGENFFALWMAGAERSIAFYFYYFDPIGENFFALFASLTYAYYYLMTLIK